MKLELRNLKKLFYTIKDENQILFENFELQKKELEKKSDNVNIYFKFYFYILNNVIVIIFKFNLVIGFGN